MVTPLFWKRLQTPTAALESLLALHIFHAFFWSSSEVANNTSTSSMVTPLFWDRPQTPTAALESLLALHFFHAFFQEENLKLRRSGWQHAYVKYGHTTILKKATNFNSSTRITPNAAPFSLPSFKKKIWSSIEAADKTRTTGMFSLLF